MAAISFIEKAPERQNQLLTFARQSIVHQLKWSTPLTIERNIENEPFWVNGCCFVTLTKQNSLRGCIGSLEPHRPLLEDVLENSRAAAFYDPRFPPVEAAELSSIVISISVLFPPKRIPFQSEQALIDSLQPGIDGVILEFGSRRATFLPSVWEMLPDAQTFFSQLKLKAGFSQSFWSDQIIAYRYHTFSFAEQ
jgi:AmmeMemoRadiSam system protein A